MKPITRFSQLDLSKTYSYADCLTWKFPEYVEVEYSEPGALPVATLPGLALEWAEIFDEI